MIIYESILDTFIFEAAGVNSKNWLELEIEPPYANLPKPRSQETRIIKAYKLVRN
jgi:hypothetical protein